MASKSTSLRARLRRLTNIHFLLAAAFISQLIIFDAGQLIPPQVVLERWIASGLFFGCLTIIWYLARNRSGRGSTLKQLLASLVVIDIALASFAVYTQRGMASRAVILYALAIITASAIGRRSALLASAALSATAYITSCVAYFVRYFNEGYKIELYGETGFYSAILVLLAMSLWAVMRPEK